MPTGSGQSSRCSVPPRRSPRFHTDIKETPLDSGEIKDAFSPISKPSFQKSPSSEGLQEEKQNDKAVFHDQNRRRSPRFCIGNGNLGNKVLPVEIPNPVGGESKETPVVLSQQSRRRSTRFLLVNRDSNDEMPSVETQKPIADKVVSSPQNLSLSSIFSVANRDRRNSFTSVAETWKEKSVEGSTRVSSGVSLSSSVGYGSVFLTNGRRRSSRFLIPGPAELGDFLRRSDRVVGTIARNDEGRGERSRCSSPAKEGEAIKRLKVNRTNNELVDGEGFSYREEEPVEIRNSREEEPVEIRNSSDTIALTPKGKCEGMTNKQRKVTAEEACSYMGWTSDQDKALHRAYLIAKPSPHFWKKVSKMVPGKSFKECFYRVHSSYPTPLVHLPRSRMKRKSTSPGNSRLDSSKPNDFFKLEEDVRKIKCNKKHALKTARHVLRKHCLLNQDQAADLFHVFENSLDSCAEDAPDLKLRRFENDLPAVHHTKGTTVLTMDEERKESPEVLKQVKNIKMHEKYIDKLLNRNVKCGFSRGASNNVKKGDFKENMVPNELLVKAAKQALLSGAREVITQFQHTQADLQSTCEIFEETDGYDRSASEFGEL